MRQGAAGFPLCVIKWRRARVEEEDESTGSGRMQVQMRRRWKVLPASDGKVVLAILPPSVCPDGLVLWGDELYNP